MILSPSPSGESNAYKNIKAQICLKFKNVVVILLVAILSLLPAARELLFSIVFFSSVLLFLFFGYLGFCFDRWRFGASARRFYSAAVVLLSAASLASYEPDLAYFEGAHNVFFS